jgi:FkbM family methyltransferase
MREILTGIIDNAKMIIRNPTKSYFSLTNSKALVELNDGHALYVNPDDLSLTPALIRSGNWEWWVNRVVKAHVQPGHTVVDIGANYGYYTVMMSGCVGNNGKVYSFEASPILFKYVQDNVNINSYSYIVEAYNKAMFSDNRMVQLTFNTKYNGGNSLYKFDEAYDNGGQYVHAWDEQSLKQTFDLQAMTLDSFAQKNSIGRVDMIRMDIEGSECAVIKGAQDLIESNADLKLVFEWRYEDQLALYSAYNHIHPDDCLEILRGYKFYSITRDLFFPYEELSYNDMLTEGRERSDVLAVPNYDMLDTASTDL